MMNPAVALAPRPAPAAAPAQALPRAASRHGLGFVLFLLVNAALFVRPAEIVPTLVGWNIYEFLILACLAASLPAVLQQFTAKSLEARPVTLCVLGLFLAVVLSFLAQLDFARLLESGVFFAKIVVYYVLFVALVDGPGRLRTFLFCMLLFATVTIGLAVLQYHGLITLPNLDQTIDHTYDKASGHDVDFVRLSGSGIFHDPNELGVLVALSSVLSLYWLFDRRSGPARALWVGPLALFLYALTLTQSRGALLALGGGLGAFLVARFGWRTALLAGLAAAPAALLMLAGRMASLSTEDGTGQQRIQIWSDGLMLMRDAPLFGVGKDKLVESVGLVAHNSYLQMFVEQGIFGGVLFVGAFYLAVAQLWRLGDRRKHAIADPEMRRLHPYLLGLVASYAVGMMSLTLCYILPTYTVLALATAFTRTVPADPPLPAVRFDLRLLTRMVAVSVGGLALLYLFVRLFLVR